MQESRYTFYIQHKRYDNLPYNNWYYKEDG